MDWDDCSASRTNSRWSSRSPGQTHGRPSSRIIMSLSRSPLSTCNLGINAKQTWIATPGNWPNPAISTTVSDHKCQGTPLNAAQEVRMKPVHFKSSSFNVVISRRIEMASLKVVSTNDNSLLIVDRLDPIRSVWQSVASGAGQLDYFGNT